MILIAVISIIFLLGSLKYPDYIFWIAVTLFLDPGGYIQTYVPRTLLGGLKITDLTFVLLFIPLISPKIKLKSFFIQRDNQWIVLFLLTYTLVYHIFVYGYIAPGGNINNVLDLLQYQRLTLWGFLSIIPAYIFFRRNYKLFFKFAITTSLILMLFYIIRLTTGLNIVPIWEFERGRNSGIMRVALLGYGFAQWFLYMLFIKIIFRLRLPKINWFYFIAITIFIAEILTLTRRVIFSMIFQFFLVYYLHQQMMGKSLLSLKLRKVLLFGFGLILVLYMIAPKYINYTLIGVEDAISIVQKGSNSSGENDGRIEGDIPKHLGRFKESPIIGYGWDELWYSNKTLEGGLSANDVPLTAALGMFGVLGLLFFMPFYLRVFKILYKTYKLLKYFYLSGKAKKNALLFTICLFLTIIFISRYTLGFMNYFNDLTSGVPRVLNMLYLGFLLAAADLLRNTNTKKEISKNL
jgi:hypothetical protein